MSDVKMWVGLDESTENTSIVQFINMQKIEKRKFFSFVEEFSFSLPPNCAQTLYENKAATTTTPNCLSRLVLY